MSETVTVPKRRPEVMAVLPALMLAMLLAMLDNMIVSPALPRIVTDLGGIQYLSWVVTAYILGTTVSTPIWGKLGDLYGRKKVFLSSIAIFLVASALTGMSQSIWELVGFRALQGLGAGGLMVGAFAIIGDLVPPRERGRYQGMMAGVMAVAMIAGPLAGGYITDHLSWRWAFYVNIPLGAIAFALLVVRLRLPKYRAEHRIDWFGVLLLTIGITALVLITTWAGTKYAWGSSQILGLGALSIVTLVAFSLLERRSPEPILPLGVFANRNFSLVTGIGFLVGFAMFGAIAFLPLFMQTVQGASATNSGLLLLPMMGGLLVTSIIGGQVITRTGRYKVFPILGGIGVVAGMYLLAQLNVDTTKFESSIGMVVLGVGLGFLMQTTILIAQNSVDPRDMGVASSTATFFRSIGGSFGVAIFGAIFNHTMTAELTTRLGPAAANQFAGSGGGGGQITGAALRALPAPVREGLLNSIAIATSDIFWWAVGAAVLVPVLAIFIREVPLRGHDEAGPRVEAAPDAAAPVALAAE